MFAVAIDGPAGKPFFGSKTDAEFPSGKFKEDSFSFPAPDWVGVYK